MARIARRPLLGGLTALAFGAPALAQQAEGGNSLRLGALFPFTGPLALLGDEHFRGLELAAEERNAAGGLLGKPIRLVRGDAAEAAQAQAEVKRLQGTERVVALFGTCASPLSFAATQAAELQGVPYIELGAIADPITDRGFRLLVRTCPRASEVGRMAVDAVAEPLSAAWNKPLGGLSVAVLHAMTRGNLPDRHLNSAVYAAHNEMVAHRWLDHPVHGERFRGTIRVNVEDIDGGLREIERWRDHPRMVQIGIPLQTRDLYGHPRYDPIWKAANETGLPVAVHIEVGHGVDSAPTPSGHARTYPQYVGFMALNYLYHLMNMIAEGVFEKYENVKVVWADGAGDMVTPFIWRMDTFGRPHLEQTPWAPRMPSAYLPGHVHFVHGSFDGPPEAEIQAEWFSMTGKEDMVMYGSSYPHWHMGDVASLPTGLTELQREKLLWRNAAELYGIDIATPVA